MRKLAIGIAVLAGISTLLIAATAFATPNTDFTTEQLSKGRFGDIDLKVNDPHLFDVKLKTKGDSDLYVVQNTVKPGGSSGWHTHPGPSLITVKSGTATFYDGDDPTCTPHVFTAGNGTIDPGDGHVHILR